MCQQRRERDQPVEHLDHRPVLCRAAHRRHLTLLVDTDDPPRGRDRMHDPDPMLVKQRVELGAQRTKTAGLHFHQLTVGADDVDHVPPDRHLTSVPRRGQYRLDGRVQRPSRSTPMPDTPSRLKVRPATCRARGIGDLTGTGTGHRRNVRGLGSGGGWDRA